VILGSFTTRYFGTVVISSVTAAITAQIFLGEQPAFAVPAYSLSVPQKPLFIFCWVSLAAVAAVLFIRTIYFSEALFDGWSLHPSFKAGLGLFLTAVLALLLPRGSTWCWAPVWNLLEKRLRKISLSL
jgi:CIC family chloride channel protein